MPLVEGIEDVGKYQLDQNDGGQDRAREANPARRDSKKRMVNGASPLPPLPSVARTLR